MKPQPFYTPSNLDRVAYCLRNAWTGWPSFAKFEEEPKQSDFEILDYNWENDGLRRLETEWSENRIRMLFSVTPEVSPITFTARVKGRLEHSLRKQGMQTNFSRKIGFRTVGENTRKQVEIYIQGQVKKERFVDRGFEDRITQYTNIAKEIDLSIPTKTNSGRYWYNLHLVLVTHNRVKLTSDALLKKLNQGIYRIANKKGDCISAGSLMPDHLHLALRGNLNSSPKEIALSYMNNTSHILGFPIWQPGFYVGTFGEFDMGAIRSKFR